MKRTLLLMRHGESQTTLRPHDDRNRALTGRGKEDVARVSRQFRQQGLWPQLILCSDAQRALETLRVFEKEISEQAPASLIEMRSDLYLASAASVVEILGQQNTSLATLMMIGHNPGWSEAVQLLTGRAVSLDTSEVAILETESTDWLTASVDWNGWTLSRIINQ